MRILLVEDDPALARQVAEALARAGYAVDRAGDGEDAEFRGATETFDAVVLDLGLPKLDGLSVLRRWRKAGRTMPPSISRTTGRRGVVPAGAMPVTLPSSRVRSTRARAPEAGRPITASGMEALAMVTWRSAGMVRGMAQFSRFMALSCQRCSSSQATSEVAAKMATPVIMSRTSAA